VSILAALRRRQHSLVLELKEIHDRVDALTPVPHSLLSDWQRSICSDRIMLFLRRHSLLSWSPAELMEATNCTEASVRRTLTRLMKDKRIKRDRHARYRHLDS